MIEPISGSWWLTEETGEVMPCQVKSANVFGVKVIDHEGEERSVIHGAVFDSDFNDVLTAKAEV